MRPFRALLLCVWAAIATAGEADGPYVMRNAAGKLEAWSVEVTAEGTRKKVVAATVGGNLAVPGVGSLPAFQVRLRPPAAIAADATGVGAKEPLFVVADTHGEFEILAGMLMKQGVVDDQLRWKFGRGRLLILGDVFDRGAHQTEILWLLYELEEQSRKAGGAVYLVLGNHETMVLRGDLRYLHAKYRDTAQLLDVASYSQLFEGASVLGQWLRSKPAVLRLNEYLCLHGGISPALIDRKFPLADINSAIRAVLMDREPAAGAERDRADFLLGESGPLWYRGYFPEESAGATATTADIDGIRKHFGVSALLVGHTRVPTITPLYDGRVYAVQVYPRRDAFGNAVFEALLIRDGKFLRALPDGRTEPL
jgi:calcineurin-like phosphoesterase family protein